MSRVLFGLNSSLALALLVAVLPPAAALAADNAKTIRIEPRAFYGATVSVEAGVRVFRPIPATSHMIINPNKTPLNLSIKDVTKRVHKTVNHYGHGGAETSNYSSAGGFYLPPRKRMRKRRGKRRGGYIHRRGGATGFGTGR
jgi:hypothetical protein